MSAAADLPPPFIYVPNAANLRDAGGHALAARPDSHVRRGLLYRAADPTLCTTDEIRFLHARLGITHIFDLRSGPEIVRQGVEVVEAFEERLRLYSQALGDGEGQGDGNSNGNGKVKAKAKVKGIRRQWTPVFQTEDYSPESIAIRFRDYGSEDSEGFVRAYSEILAHGGPSYGVILRQLGRPDTGGVLLHCTAGKDRTGVLVAVVLLLLGVSRSDTAQEYHLTETGLRHRRPAFIERIMSSGAFEGEEGMAAAGRMVGARKESMERTLVMVEERWGGVENYVRNVCGLSEDEVQALRDRLVETGGTAEARGGGGPAAQQERAVL